MILMKLDYYKFCEVMVIFNKFYSYETPLYLCLAKLILPLLRHHSRVLTDFDEILYRYWSLLLYETCYVLFPYTYKPIL
jgi:hypothetical protein